MIEDSYESESDDALDSDDLGDDWSWEWPSGVNLAGKTLGECAEAAIARTTFLDLLFSHERVLRLFMSWGMRTGIIHAAQSAAGILEEIAEREGFADIKDFLDSVAPGLLPETLSEPDEISDEELADDMADEEDSSDEEEILVVMSPTAFCAASLGLSDLAASEMFDLSDVPVIEVGDEDVIHTDALWALWYQEMDDVHAGFDELDETILIDEAAQLVEKLGCSWKWLVADLIDRFPVWIRALLYDLDIQIVSNLKQLPPKQKIPSLTVEYRPNESTEESIQRTKREYDEWCQNFKEIPRGAMPGVKKEYRVVRRVVWFYLSRILGESDYAIAKAFKVDHKAIPKGIRRTEDLLNLISSEFE